VPDIVATRSGIRVHADPARVAALREEFAARHVLRLPRFLDTELLDRARREIDAGTFVPREDEGIAVELNLPESRALDLLLFAMNSAELFAFIREVTNCASMLRKLCWVSTFATPFVQRDAVSTTGGGTRP